MKTKLTKTASLPPRKPAPMLTLAQLARRLDLPQSRATRLLRGGVLVPDIVAGRMHLFDGRRLPQLRTAAKG